MDDLLPAWIDKVAWEGFVTMRKSIKKPLTERGAILAIKKLEKLLKQGHDPTTVLDQSTFHSWQGLFPVKEEVNGSQNGGGGGSGRRSEPKSFHQRDCEEAIRVKQAVRTRLGVFRGGSGLGDKPDPGENNGRREIASSIEIVHIPKMEDT